MIVKLLTRVVLPLGIIAGGAFTAYGVTRMAPSAETRDPAPVVAKVEVVVAKAETRPALVRATGVVDASTRITVIPEVSGRVVSQSPNLIQGGRFQKGDVMFSLDARDYRLAVSQEESRVRQAELELELEQARQAAAERDWALLGDGRPADEAPLALRRSQLATTERALEGARSALERARLNLERATLRAPFDALVVQESVDPGQVVGPGSPIITLLGTSRFRVDASVPVEDLAVLDIPGVSAEEGSPATVVQDLGGRASIVRQGHILRLAGELDANTRTARLLVAVPDPLDPPDGGLPLMPGAYVDITLEGRPLEGVIAVPRAAIHGGDRVWIVDDEERLAERTLTVAWRTEEEVLVSAGLEDGDRIVTTPLGLPLAGMPVEIIAPSEPR